VKRELPSGTVTFLFTDVEGSTRLLHALGAEAYADALAEHRRVLRNAFTRHGGVEVDTQGDAFFIAFPTAPGALAAAAEAHDALASGPIRVRIGIHTGTPHLTDEGYVGPDVHRAARIAAAGHGGQILVSAATASLINEEGLRDLGEHRLKDLSAPERIYQLGGDEHPPLKTLHQTNLPMPASSFVGREAELADLERLLTDGGARVLTLTGPGGTGKTRLAIQAAASAGPQFPGGVFWVGLSALRDAALVPDTIATAIGAKSDLAEHIGDGMMLLVVDNLEQVIDAAPQLGALVGACPNLRLIVTSRELLRVRGERGYGVAPLAEHDAVELFCERAALPRDATIEQLCAALENLPLAIELAAARTSVLSPRQILDRLGSRLDLLKGGRDVDPRQQTLRTTIEWSHELLAPGEKRLFARLAIFRGGWTLEAAEKVADADVETLGSLVDKSLVTRTAERFRMLETIREYAHERLADAADSDDIGRRHFDHVLELVEQWYAERFASESRWLPMLEAENDNIRAALDWADKRSAGDAVRLAGAVAPLWMLHAQSPEALHRVKAALADYSDTDEVRARALTHLGEIADDVASLEEALALWRSLGNPAGEALALEALGWVHDALGDMEVAQAAHEQSLEVRGRASSPEVEGLSARAGLCHVLVVRGETGRAESVAGELLTIAQRHDAALMQELALHFMADCPLVDGDYGEAELRYRRALAYARNAGLVGRATDELLGVAMALAGTGDSMRAVRLAAAAHAKQAEIGKTSDVWWRGMQDRLLGAARESLPPDELERAERDGKSADFDATVEELLAEEGE
jgi:predicted ATPase/class 3 adenylate cyclase